MTMTVPIFTAVVPLSRAFANEYGETPLAYAPHICLNDCGAVVPQQYLDVERTLTNLENILADVTVPKGFLLFAGQGDGGLFILVAVFGEENYRQASSLVSEDKIVYGRRWMIEPTTPTSEVVQTAMLAIKKAREHELREKFVVSINAKSVNTTPFNCHQDLPLMVANKQRMSRDIHDAPFGESAINALLRNVKIDGLTLQLNTILALGERSVVDISVQQCDESITFSELNGRSLTVVCEEPSISHFMHQLFNACLSCSDRYVEENTFFKGFARFSHDVSPQAIAEFSYLTRSVKAQDHRFDNLFKDMSYRVDSAKAPIINGGRLGQQQRLALADYVELAGYQPIEPEM